MKKENVLKSCYALFRNITPLNIDCGKLCGGKCCKGDDKTGMLLFPGEEKLIDRDINITENDDGQLFALCNGFCNRNYRPLSCRIYPLFPVLKNENGNEYIEVEYDPRANCPLCSGEPQVTATFVKAVKRAGKYLLLSEETAESYRKISAEIDEINNLKELLFK